MIKNNNEKFIQLCSDKLSDNEIDSLERFLKYKRYSILSDITHYVVFGMLAEIILFLIYSVLTRTINPVEIINGIIPLIGVPILFILFIVTAVIRANTLKDKVIPLLKEERDNIRMSQIQFRYEFIIDAEVDNNDIDTHATSIGFSIWDNSKRIKDVRPLNYISIKNFKPNLFTDELVHGNFYRFVNMGDKYHIILSSEYMKNGTSI